MMKYVSFLVLMCWLLAVQDVLAQQASEKKPKEKKQFNNTIRFNATNPLIFGKNSFVLGYERVLNDHSSFSISIGRTTLPSLGVINTNTGDSTIRLHNDRKDYGFQLTGDYRFYLASENKHRAPRGVYIGPYASFVSMGRKNQWTLDTDNFQGDIDSKLDFQFISVGAQLGYQFVVWDRLAIDFVLVGPGVAFYEFGVKFNTNLDPDDESALWDKINEALEEKFPGYTFALDGEFKHTGSSKTTSLGYRYVVHLGFRF